MHDVERTTTPPRRPRPGRWSFVLASLLAASLLVVAIVFPFIWSAATGKPLGGTLGRLASSLTGANSTPAGALVPYGTPGASAVATDQLTWPGGKSVLEKWNARTAGQGTIFGYYMTSTAQGGYRWSEGIAFPIPPELGGDGFRVMIVEWPRGDDPAAPGEMHIATGRLYRQANGDLLPRAETWVGGCVLDSSQARWVAANGVPDGLTHEIVQAADAALGVGNQHQYPNPQGSIEPAKHIPTDDANGGSKQP
ncbi:MAG: hypothetical protein IT438_12110 [Phycisphaerales bacterium]|nr:hypothetical protein [Phycisphaerales bacterium]